MSRVFGDSDIERIPTKSLEYAFINNDTGGTFRTIPSTGNEEAPQLWTTMDSLASNMGTFNMDLDDQYECILRITGSFVNINSYSSFGMGVAVQFQNGDDSWDTSNIIFKWFGVHPKENSTILIPCTLLKNHGYKAFRILVNSSPTGTSINWGYGGYSNRNFLLLERTYNLEH